jgi:hypothetical protein
MAIPTAQLNPFAMTGDEYWRAIREIEAEANDIAEQIKVLEGRRRVAAERLTRLYDQIPDTLKRCRQHRESL